MLELIVGIAVFIIVLILILAFEEELISIMCLSIFLGMCYLTGKVVISAVQHV